MNKLIEPGLIGLALLLSALFVTNWPSHVSAGLLVLAFSTVFLIHTLIRDLVLYTKQKRASTSAPKRVQRCFCVESGVGVVFVIVGLILLLGNYGGSVILQKSDWVLSLTGLMVMNYGLKDLVFSWRPWRIYRDPDHLNIIPRL